MPVLVTTVNKSENGGKTIAVIGAGIVGVSTAIWLQRSGHQVVIFDPKGPAGGTSYGNAGVLASASIVPVTIPGLLKKAPLMLFDRDSPLFLRWSRLPQLVPFLLKYLRHANNADVDRISSNLSLLLHDSADQHLALAQGTGAERHIQTGDYLFGYKDRAAYEADSYSWNIRREKGHPFEELDADQLAAYDPAIAGRFGFGVRCPDHGHVRDPGAYVKALAAHVEANGGRLLAEAVTDIVVSGNRATGVQTQSSLTNVDDVVLATGVWSGPLAARLGVKVPMVAERGYHIEFVNPSVVPKSPIMVASGKFVMTPMEGRLRCAGIVEFGGIDDAPSREPFNLLRRQTQNLLPELTFDRIDEWMGMRPSTSDSLPLIGASPNVSNVWMGFGHQHIGLTAGPKTGRWLKGLITGEKVNIDLSHFNPNRFGR